MALGYILFLVLCINLCFWVLKFDELRLIVDVWRSYQLLMVICYKFSLLILFR